MFSAPYGLAPSGRESAGSHLSVATFTRETSFSLPHGNARPSVPRAAFSHSLPVGRRLPAQLANWCASSPVTFTTGKSGLSLGNLSGSGRPVALQKSEYSAFVTVVLSI